MALFLGIDGGTGCRALICDVTDTAVGSGAAGPANIMSGTDDASLNIVQATQAAAQRSERLPFHALQIENDANIALHGAIGSQNGAAAILGTGWAFIQRRARFLIPLGGWGLIIGNHGNGAMLGRSMLEQTLLAGANLDMMSGVRFMVHSFVVSVDEALNMASLYPAKCLGAHDHFGNLKAGAAANMIHLSHDLEINSIRQSGEKL